MQTSEKTTTAQPEQTDRIWIGLNAETRCDLHAGASLSAAITARPRATHHTTDLDDWVAITRADASCETCENRP